MEKLETSNPAEHIRNIQTELEKLATHLREDIAKVTDKETQELFRTTAEVIDGLHNSFEQFIEKNEHAWEIR
jgi:hypothetical protein